MIMATIRKSSLTAATLAALGLVALLGVGGTAAPAAAVSNTIVISQVYGGGGNSGATYRNDFVELFNRGAVAVNVTGWSIQYAATTGTSWAKVDLSGTISPGRYYLVQLASGGAIGALLPTADATGTINMSGSAGKVVLLNTNTLITSGTSCPSSVSVVDVCGYGSGTNCAEGGSPTATLSATTAAKRTSGGCDDTDLNAADFGVGAPDPKNSLAAVNDCNAVPAIQRTWGSVKSIYR
jgi:hypothetical protein